MKKVSDFCADWGLTISKEKSKITNTFKDKALFLGTQIRHGKVYTYSKRNKGILQRNTRGLLLTAPMNWIRKKFKDAGFTKNNLGRTRES